MEGRTPELPRDSAWGALWWWPPGVRLAEEQLPGPCLHPLSAPLSLSFLLHPMLMTSSWASPQQKLSSNSLLSESLSRSRPPNADQPFPHPPGLSLWLRHS